MVLHSFCMYTVHVLKQLIRRSCCSVVFADCQSHPFLSFFSRSFLLVFSEVLICVDKCGIPTMSPPVSFMRCRKITILIRATNVASMFIQFSLTKTPATETLKVPQLGFHAIKD